MRDRIRSRLDGVVRGLKRGSRIVRAIDPGGKLWLNEAAKSDQETLSRCLPYLDVVSYDFYPVPEDPSRGRQMHMIGGFTDRFRETARGREVWVVEQAFTWGLERCIREQERAYSQLQHKHVASDDRGGGGGRAQRGRFPVHGMGRHQPWGERASMVWIRV